MTAQGFLYCMNAITLLLGALLLGFSIYVTIEFKNGWDTFTSLSAVYAGIAAGVFMILVSFLGCAAAQKDQGKGLVFCYLLLVTLILGLQIGAAVGIMQYSGFISDQNGLFSAELISSGSIALNNGVLSAYTACCSGCPNPSACNNTLPFYNQTVDNCLNQNLTCTLVGPCSTGNTETCYVYQPNEVALLPPNQIDITLCTALSDLSQNGSKIVGPAATGACGNGNPAAFKKNMNDFFSSRFYWVAVAFCVIAGIQGLIVLASMWVLCCVTSKNHR